jgi:hypothetical protein
MERYEREKCVRPVLLLRRFNSAAGSTVVLKVEINVCYPTVACPGRA